MMSSKWITTTTRLLRMYQSRVGRIVTVFSQMLRKQGVFAASVVKKRRYWPRYIDGDVIKALFENKDIGDADTWAGTLEGTPFHLFSMKEPDYVMTMMSTYGTLSRQQKSTDRKSVV